MRGLILFLFCLTSCASERTPHISEIYREAALDEVRNPVVVIHGILGAQLRQRSTNKIVWGAFTDEGIDPETPSGARAIALPLRPKGDDTGERDVYASMPLGQLQLSFLYKVISVAVYQQILGALGVGGYTDQVVEDPTSPNYGDDHYTCFTFFYDWRRDNVENAIALGEFLAKTKVEVETKAMAKVVRLRATGEEAGAIEAQRIEEWIARGTKFDIVAHSMGGLIARYYLRYGQQQLPPDGSLPQLTWAGSELIDRLVLVGTPSLGSVVALDQLCYGYQAAAILPHFSQVLLGTMPAIYQLLPRARHKPFVDAFGETLELDPLDPAVWKSHGWGLFADQADQVLRMLLPDVADVSERRRIAEGYATWCLERARHFHAAIDRVPDSKPPTELYLFAGDVEDTPTRVRLGSDGGPVFEGTGLSTFGDGTVPRYSAIGDERFGQASEPWLRSPVPWDNVTFIADDHIGLTSNPAFTNNLLFLLLEKLPR